MSQVSRKLRTIRDFDDGGQEARLDCCHLTALGLDENRSDDNESTMSKFTMLSVESTI